MSEVITSYCFTMINSYHLLSKKSNSFNDVEISLKELHGSVNVLHTLDKKLDCKLFAHFLEKNMFN